MKLKEIGIGAKILLAVLKFLKLSEILWANQYFILLQENEMFLQRYRLILILILLLGFLLRVLFLGDIPNGLSYEEATIGLRAQNLINNGKDEFGRSFPLT